MPGLSRNLRQSCYHTVRPYVSINVSTSDNASSVDARKPAGLEILPSSSLCADTPLVVINTIHSAMVCLTMQMLVFYLIIYFGTCNFVSLLGDLTGFTFSFVYIVARPCQGLLGNVVLYCLTVLSTLAEQPSKYHKSHGPFSDLVSGSVATFLSSAFAIGYHSRGHGVPLDSLKRSCTLSVIVL